MPGDVPQTRSRQKLRERIFICGNPLRLRHASASISTRGGILAACLAGAIGSLVPVQRARAQESWLGSVEVVSSTEVILLAVFCGAMSFAILSACWMIRERSRILTVNEKLQHRIADLRATNEKLDALVNSADQCVVVWDDADARPTIFGRLAGSRSAPEAHGDFLAFGKWLTTESAIAIETAIKQLRGNADSFEIALTGRNGDILEAKGAVSGGQAFVRFSELSQERAATSLLRSENEQLRGMLDVIQSLFSNLPQPVWLREPSGKLYWANTAYARAVDCADGREAVESGAELLDTGQLRSVSTAQNEDGVFAGQLPLVVSGDRRIFDITDFRSPAGSAGLAVDRGEAEEIRGLLNQTIETHAQTLDHLATAVAMFDGQQQLQFYNSSFQKLWNLPDGFLSSKPTNAQLLDAIRAEGRLPEFPDWRKWRESQLEIYRALETREDWWHLPDGQTLRVIANPHSQGGATWVFENVTEQLTLQSNYNALMRIQGETLDSLNEAVAVFGLDGRLRLCNPAFGRFWRLDESQLDAGIHIATLSRHCSEELADPQLWDRIAESITGMEDHRDDQSGRLETIRGEIFDYSLVRLPEGQTMLALADMTASVNIERALKERNEALEQSDHLKNQFIQHVSYELRAPLTSIAGFSELLTSVNVGRLNTKQAEYVGHISQSADVLTAIIDDILDLATIDAGAMTLDIEPVDIREQISDCVSEFGPELERHGIHLETEINTGAESLDADARRLRQIIGNLLSNAVNFSPDGAKITISAVSDGKNVDISITDEGPGVQEADRERIFGRFEGRSSGNRRKGVGLGLSIARSFCELHGGSLHVEAAGERGAKFVCSLPKSQDGMRRAA